MVKGNLFHAPKRNLTQVADSAVFRYEGVSLPTARERTIPTPFAHRMIIHTHGLLTIDNRCYTGVMYDTLIETLVAAKAVKATKYISEKEIIRATRTRYGRSFSRGNLELTITRGKPNYLEREFIKACKNAKEPFPIKKVQLKYLPSKKKLP